MIDPQLRQILEPIHELHQINSPPDVVERAMRRAKTSLNCQPPWYARPMRITAGASALAAVIALAIIITHKSVPFGGQERAQLRSAIEASNQYRGLVKVQMTDEVLDAQGRPKAPPQTVQASVDTSQGVVTLTTDYYARGLAAKHASILPAQHAQPNVAAPLAIQANPSTGPHVIQSPTSGMLLPLTWEGVTVKPIPLTWDEKPARYISAGTLTMLSRIAERGQVKMNLQTAPAASVRPAGGLGTVTLLIDPVANLVTRMEMSIPQQQGVYRLLREYQYLGPPGGGVQESPATQPRR